MDLSIKGNAWINHRLQQCCIDIKNGKICKINKTSDAEKQLDFGNKIILPAGIDIHVHLRDPGFTHKEDFSSGTLAAAFGGITCVADMPNTNPPTVTKEKLQEKADIASKKAHVDYALYAGVTDDNISSIKDLAGYCNGFKIYLGETTSSIPFTNQNLISAFNNIKKANKPVLIHAEDMECLHNHAKKEDNLLGHQDCRPAECESMAIRAILQTAREMKTRIHVCHMSSTEGLNALAKKPVNVSCGVTPHHLLLTAEPKYVPQTYYKVNPPLRNEGDKEALLNGFLSKRIDIIESDHAPHSLEEKNNDFNDAPSGVPGVETMLPLLFAQAKNKAISLERIVASACEKPAALLNLNKGYIKEGFDADLLVVDLNNTTHIKAKRLHQKCGWTPFEDFPAVFPTDVFLRGKRIIKEGSLNVSPGFGKHVG